MKKCKHCTKKTKRLCSGCNRVSFCSYKCQLVSVPHGCKHLLLEANEKELNSVIINKRSSIPKILDQKIKPDPTQHNSVLGLGGGSTFRLLTSNEKMDISQNKKNNSYTVTNHGCEKVTSHVGIYGRYRDPILDIAITTTNNKLSEMEVKSSSPESESKSNYDKLVELAESTISEWRKLNPHLFK